MKKLQWNYRCVGLCLNDNVHMEASSTCINTFRSSCLIKLNQTKRRISDAKCTFYVLRIKRDYIEREPRISMQKERAPISKVLLFTNNSVCPRYRVAGVHSSYDTYWFWKTVYAWTLHNLLSSRLLAEARSTCHLDLRENDQIEGCVTSCPLSITLEPS
jgi:hypothetical protein